MLGKTSSVFNNKKFKIQRENAHKSEALSRVIKFLFDKGQ